jgi:hypothetical protein
MTLILALEMSKLSLTGFIFFCGTLKSLKTFLRHTSTVFYRSNMEKICFNHYFTILRRTWREPAAHYCAPAQWLRTTGLATDIFVK